MFVITSECMQEKRPAFRHRVFALCLMSLGLALTLMLTTVSIRVTYVTDSNGASQLLLTSESDPTRLMNLSGIEAAEGDRVYYTAFGDSLATLNIERAFTVTVEADGQQTPVKMVYGTVAEALEKAGITLGPDDYTVPAQDSLVGIGSTIQVHRVRYEETVEYQTIPHDTEYVYTSLYFRDTDRTTTLQTGQDGQCAITTRHRWVDGELENSIVTDVTTTVEPRDALIKAYGAGAPVSPLTGPDGTTNPLPATPRCSPARPPAIIPGAAMAPRAWAWAMAPWPLTPTSSPTAPCCISPPPTGVSSTAMRWRPIPASPCRTAMSWWICSTRPTPNRC